LDIGPTDELASVDTREKKAHTAEQGRHVAHLDPKMAVSTRQPQTSEKDQLDLAKRLRHGERAAAETLVEMYYERIYLFMRAMGHDSQRSEDLTQEAFMRAWYHIGQLRNGKALTGWLFRIASNVSRLHWRKHKHSDRVHSDQAEPAEGGVDGLARAGQREEFAHLHEAVARLPWKLRQVIVLHYMDQLTIAEAAEAAQIRTGTLKSRLNRALEALRKQMDRENE
jgi:RNA polymerase sigma-70 factor (ECF subfamily)